MRNILLYSFIFIFINTINAQNSVNFLEKDVTLKQYKAMDMSIVDIDNDGDDDIVTVNRENIFSGSSGHITWFENVNNEYFDHYVIHDGFEIYSFLDYGDLDADGDIDLIATTLDSNHLVWFKNDGNQEFDTIRVSDNLLDPGDLIMTDYDQDGHLDIVTLSHGDEEVVWYENDGNQNFNKHVVGVENAFNKLLVNDLDGDGDLDIIGGGVDGVDAFINDGTQNHTLDQLYTSLFQVRDIKIADLDQDSDKDILVCQEIGMYYLENDGSDNFSTVSITIIGAKSAEILDFDSDGDLDILTSDAAYGTIGLFENDGNENFTVDSLGVLPDKAEQVFTNDINGDGYLDIIAPVNDDWDIRVYYGDVDGNYSGVDLISTNLLKQSIIVDFDNDGDLDILTENFVWHEKLANGKFIHHRIYHEDLSHMSDFLAQDIDGDGDVDIVSTTLMEGVFSWHENNGNQSFTEHEITVSSDFVRDIRIVDFDLDGDMDFVAVRFTPTGLVWLKNDGNQNFTEQDIGTAYTPYDIEVVDLDLDGDLDVLGVYNGGNAIRWHENDGSFNFTLNEVSTTGLNSWDIQSFDFDNDGDLDLFVGPNTLNNINYYENTGNENFAAPVEIVTMFNAFSFDIKDFNNDGLEDLLVHSLSEIEVYLNNGMSGFSAIPAASLPEVRYPSIDDFDGDGDIDLVCIASGVKTNLRVYDNLLINNYLHLEIKPFLDENHNGIFDSNEYGGIRQAVYIDPLNAIQISSTNNNHLYLDLTQEFNVNLDLDTTIWAPSDSLNRYVVIDTIMPIDSIIPIGYYNLHDVLIQTDITGQWPRCNRIITHKLQVENYGNTLDSGVFYYELDSLAQFISSVPSPDSVSGQQYFYDFTDFTTASMRTVDLQVKMPLSLDLLNHELNVLADTNNTTSVNIADDIYNELVRCSYDPNDKSVLPNYGDSGYILSGDTLEYLIRFQNTGNDTAFTVEITDQLDSSLDLSSFNLISSSHPVSIQIDNDTRQAIFLFEDIILTDTVTNEPESHGFVKYTIETLDNLPQDMQITNEAYIYFDENSPIITNSTLNTIYNCETIGENISFNAQDFYVGDNIPLEVNVNHDFISSAQWLLNGVNMSSNLEDWSYMFNTSGNYELRIILENDLCSYDSTYIISVLDNIGLSELGSNIKIYPNPTSEQLNIDLDRRYEHVNVTILNNLGQIISNKMFYSKQNIDMKLEGDAGLYFMEITLENKASKVLKVLKK